MLLAEVVATSSRVAATTKRSEKIATLASLLASLGVEEAPVVITYLSGRPRQDRLGVGYATVYAVEEPPADAPSLDVLTVDAALQSIGEATGPGSKAAKERLLRELLAAATEPEQEFLRGLVLRNLRQGALDGVMADAVAMAAGVDAAMVRRAAMLAGDLVEVGARALTEGQGALEEYGLRVGTPVQPMLAQTAESAGEAVAAMGAASVEWKLDGARIQLHRTGDEVQVFTRNLNAITDRVPEIVDVALRLDVGSVILDGEALLTDAAGAPQAFQDSMSRFGADSDRQQRLRPFFFDVLAVDGRDLIDQPLRQRRAELERVVHQDLIVPAIQTDEPDRAERFYAEAVGASHEGVVVKDLESPYEAGRRGGSWIKVKPSHTLDLVVLAAEWGSGRRRGWLSNIHLGARDPSGGYVMLGKTFKGLTDAMLTEQTERFLQIETSRRGHVVHLEPKIVYEIAFDGVQRSSRYPGGMALRFARVKRFRPDKGPEDADTVDTVRSIMERRM